MKCMSYKKINFKSSKSNYKTKKESMIHEAQKFFLEGNPKNITKQQVNLSWEHHLQLHNFLKSDLCAKVLPEYKEGVHTYLNINNLLFFSLYHESYKKIPRSIKKKLNSNDLMDTYTLLKKQDFEGNSSMDFYIDTFSKNLPLLIFKTIDIAFLPLDGDKDYLVSCFGFSSNDKKFEEEKMNVANIMSTFYYSLADYSGFNIVFNKIRNTSTSVLYPLEHRKVLTQLYDVSDKLQSVKKSFEDNFHDLRNENKDITFHKFENNSFIKGRIKEPGSITLKLIERKFNLNIRELHDLIAFTVLVDSEDEAYKFHNFLKEKYRSELYEDYIQNPRKTGYQALHTDIFYNGIRVEIQIKTPEMYRNSECGNWSHALYKSNSIEKIIGIDRINKLFSVLKGFNSVGEVPKFISRSDEE